MTAAAPREILFFAAMAQAANTRVVRANFGSDQTVGDVRVWVETQFPQLGSLLRVSAIALDRQIAVNETLLGPTREIAILPPVSGG